MQSEGGEVVLVYNGEIYNYRELRADLESRGFSFHGSSDSEVLLQLYMSDGLGMLARLNGIFAFAIYDRRTRVLFLARDGQGVKPLYFLTDAGQFAFASEIKALQALIGDLGPLDHAALDRYLTFLWCPGSGTPFQRVRKLAPGEALCVREGSVVRQWTWSSVAFPEQGTESRLDPAETADALLQELRSAVQAQLIADVPVGAFLSGGLDSSAVVALAHEAGAQPRCFTIDPAGGSDPGVTEDLPYARRIASRFGLSLESVPVDADRLIRDLEWMIWQLDEPLADPAGLNVFYIAKRAREQGIKVLLAGTGADDLFAGYRRHLALRYEGLWSRLPGWIPEIGKSRFARTGPLALVGRRLERLGMIGGETESARLASYFFWSKREDLLGLYTPAMRADLGSARPDQPMIDFLAQPAFGCATPMNRMLALEQRFFLGDHNLTYTDKMGMAAGVEIRVPFLAPGVVALAAGLPDSWKQRGRVGKWILKKAMGSCLPKEVIDRPKTGFGAPLRRWIGHELHGYLTDLLSEESLLRRGLFDPKRVHRLIAANDAGQQDATYTLFALLCVEIWCRRFLDSGTTRVGGETQSMGRMNHDTSR
jgi:asparagine synthase (glutamine-hydrolysing)